MQLKYSTLVAFTGGITAALMIQSASAQSSVMLGGMIDIGIRYLTNDNAQNAGRLFMTNGAVINSHFGLGGKEDLGNGLKAVFELENNFNPQDGTPGDRERLFDSEAYVGFESPYGTLTFGRQNTPLFDKLISDYDPLTYANYPENSWLPYALGAGLAADNAIKYTGQFGNVYVGAFYSSGTNYESTGAAGFSGQVPGHPGAGAMYALLASYTKGPLSAGAGMQQASDNSNNKQTLLHANFAYAFGATKAYAGYMRSRDNTGLVDALLAEQPIPDISQLKNTDRTDDGPFAGVSWKVGGPLLISGAFYYDHMRNAATEANALGSGSRYTVVALAEYSLSKRTEVYGTVDFNKVDGAAGVELPGRGNQTGVALGLRNFF
jgi:predicted porin